MEKPKDLCYGLKIVIVGDGAVGKTSFFTRYTENGFTDNYNPTIFDNFYVEVAFEDKSVACSLWDTAGQEDYDRLRPLSYTTTDLFIYCFSMVDKDSLKNIEEKWHPEVMKNKSDKYFKHFLVGVKTDLVEKTETEKAVTREEAKETCANLKIDGVFFVSNTIDKNEAQAGDDSVASVFDNMIKVYFSTGNNKKNKKKCQVF